MNFDNFFKIISVVATIFTIYKAIKETSEKTHLQNIECAMKYFSKEGIEKLDKEPKLIRDMACESISHFRGLSFKTVRNLLKVDSITIYDLSKLKVLVNKKLINWINHKYSLEKEPKFSLKLFKFLCWVVFSIYISILIFIYVKYFTINNSVDSIIYIISIIFSVGIPEVFMLMCIEKRELVDWFKNNENRFKEKSIKLMINT